MGFALFAISYDEVATLAAFAAKHEITYPLLSDVGSVTIRSLGLINEQLAEQHAVYGVTTRDEQRGVAYPGTFVLDERGLIQGKHFEQSYRVRPTRSIVLDWATSGGGSDSAKATATETPSAIEVSAWTDEPTYRPYQQLRLHVRLTLPRNMHVYAAPVPPGYQALSVELEPLDGLEVGASMQAVHHLGPDVDATGGRLVLAGGGESLGRTGALMTVDGDSNVGGWLRLEHGLEVDQMVVKDLSSDIEQLKDLWVAH
jgi:hypothetical protein